MDRRHQANAVIVVDQVDGARVGDAGHGQPRDGFQGGLELEGLGERRTGAREEGGMLSRAALLVVQLGGRERGRRHVAQRPGGLHLDGREMMGTAIVEAERGGGRALGAERNRDDRVNAFVGVHGHAMPHQLRREDVLDNQRILYSTGPPSVARFAKAAETPSNERTRQTPCWSRRQMA